MRKLTTQFASRLRWLVVVIAGVTWSQVSWDVSAQGVRALPLTVQQLADRASTGAWDTFTSQVTVKRQRVGANGQPTGPAATVEEYEWQRAKTRTGWKTTMTVLKSATPSVRGRTGVVALTDLPSVTRIEDAEDGTAPRFFSRTGLAIAMPSMAQQRRYTGLASPGIEPALLSQAEGRGRGLRPVQGPEWVEAFVMSPSTRQSRLRAFDRQFGRRSGAVRGLTRYLRDDVDGRREGLTREVIVREVLVDDQSGVPVEANVVRGGELVSHSTFAYERAVSGAMVRRGVRIERAASSEPGAAGSRLVTEVGYSNVRLDLKGVR